MPKRCNVKENYLKILKNNYKSNKNEKKTNFRRNYLALPYSNFLHIIIYSIIILKIFRFTPKLNIIRHTENDIIVITVKYNIITHMKYVIIMKSKIIPII